MEIKGFRKCDGCFTAKVVMGLGMVEMKCPTCNGVGYLEKVDDEIAYLEKIKDSAVVTVFPESDVIVGFEDKPAVFASTGENVIVVDDEPSEEIFQKIIPVMKSGEVFQGSISSENVIEMDKKNNFKSKSEKLKRE